MKKGIQLACCITIVSIGTLGIAIQPSFAASTTSKGDIILERGTTIHKPVDPTLPGGGHEITPTDPDVNPPTPGPLSIDYISNIHFGKQKISGNDITYYADSDHIKINSTGVIKAVPNYIQITDDRGNNAGWKLTVQQDSPFKNGTHTLKGAILKFNNPKADSVKVGSLNKPRMKAITLDSTGANASEAISAAENQGMGTWVHLYGASAAIGKRSITLDVPGEVPKVEGLYKTTLTWTLGDVPD
ncbi:WxL domain-containing protein [Listeria weihenstephanensis]|uniref:WxL domain-containing protein n=1 Tax=Listeria weihenstephanensis TaxID=1006155 RepID=A0A841Z7Y6_9LIST|nr:WxL domain-containing protein [Listeria weihenstephanensis]MBC1501330.1 WxL domain-containing protein [Listeria weihenstephanensis]